MTLSYRDVAEILKIVDASRLEALDLDIEGVKLSVRRGGAAAAVGAPAATGGGGGSPPSASAAPDAGDQPQGPAPAQASAAPEAPAAGGGTEVRAPMLGTFFRRPSPSEPPFVEVGDQVEAGEPVGLIEVMKLFTTLEAPCSGRVAAILVEDAELVEFDQALIRIDPA